MKWQDKLTKEELQHVRQWGGKTLTGFKGNRHAQREMQLERGGSEPCLECKHIAIKLGIEY